MTIKRWSYSPDSSLCNSWSVVSRMAGSCNYKSWWWCPCICCLLLSGWAILYLMSDDSPACILPSPLNVSSHWWPQYKSQTQVDGPRKKTPGKSPQNLELIMSTRFPLRWAPARNYWCWYSEMFLIYVGVK